MWQSNGVFLVTALEKEINEKQKIPSLPTFIKNSISVLINIDWNSKVTNYSFVSSGSSKSTRLRWGNLNVGEWALTRSDDKRAQLKIPPGRILKFWGRGGRKLSFVEIVSSRAGVDSDPGSKARAQSRASGLQHCGLNWKFNSWLFKCALGSHEIYFLAIFTIKKNPLKTWAWCAQRIIVSFADNVRS